MLIASALAHDSGASGTGSSGGGIALLVILAAGVSLYVLYSAARRWRKANSESVGPEN